jgi:hypothetical protein
MEKSQAPLLIIHTNPTEQYDPSGKLYNCFNNGACTEINIKLKSVDADFEVITNLNQAVKSHEALSPYVSSYLGIDSVLWAGSLPILDVKNYFNPLKKWQDSIGSYARTVVNRFPTTHFIGLFPPYRYATDLEGASLLSSMQFGNQFIRLYRNDQAFPRLQFAQKVKAISNSADQINALSQFDPDDQKTVVANLEKDTTFDVLENKAQIIKDERTQVIIQTEQNSAGFLVLRDVLLKGWEATIDGQPATINRVDGIFRGVIVPGGKHTVVFKYSPKWVKPAIYIEIISIGIFVLLVVLARKQTLHKKKMI